MRFSVQADRFGVRTKTYEVSRTACRFEVSIFFAGVAPSMTPERVFFNLLVRIHFIIVIIGWTGLAPWVFEFPFPA